MEKSFTIGIKLKGTKLCLDGFFFILFGIVNDRKKTTKEKGKRSNYLTNKCEYDKFKDKNVIYSRKKRRKKNNKML